MLEAELLKMIANGENSGVEFKRDDIHPEDLGKEIVALANFQGGRILLGVEDDGKITGIRDKGKTSAEEWVMECFRNKVYPQIIPYYEEITTDQGLKVAVITIEQGASKPYVLRHHEQERIYIRVGTTSRNATREEQARLYETGSMLHLEIMPVSGTGIASLDMDRVRNYLFDVIKDPERPENEEQWIHRLTGLGFLVRQQNGNTPCTIAGLLSFGIAPRRYLPQAGFDLWPSMDQISTIRPLLMKLLMVVSLIVPALMRAEV